MTETISATRGRSAQPVTQINGRPVYQAIDTLTAITLDVQRLHRQLAQGQPVDLEHLAVLTQTETQLHNLGTLLAAMRDDASQPS